MHISRCINSIYVVLNRHTYSSPCLLILCCHLPLIISTIETLDTINPSPLSASSSLAFHLKCPFNISPFLYPNHMPSPQHLLSISHFPCTNILNSAFLKFLHPILAHRCFSELYVEMLLILSFVSFLMSTLNSR